MIYGNINDVDTMIEMHPKIIEVIKLALKQDPLSLTEGSYPIVGDDIFMNVISLTTQAAKTKQFELHQRYIDIQILLNGEERLDFAAQHQAIEPDNYHESDDYQLCEQVHDQQTIKLQTNHFAIFMPYEPHKPGVSTNADGLSIKKVVIKLKLSQLY